MSSASGYMGAKYVQEFGPIVFDMSWASGCMGAKYCQEFGQKYMPVLCQEYMLFFCLPLSSQPRLNLLSTQQQGRAPPVWRPPPLPARAPVVVCWALAEYSMANRKIAYTLGRGRAYISDMSSTSGYMGAKYFQEFGPRFLDMSYCQKGSHLQRGVDFCCQTGLHRGGYNYEI